MIKEHRTITFVSLRSRGASGDAAALAALALHPFDDSRAPSRRLEQLIRKRSRQFAKAVQKAPSDAIRRLAVEALDDYRRMASDSADEYYLRRYEEAPAAVGTEVTTGPIDGTDPHA